MSSDILAVVEALQFNNYLSLVIATAVTYDYIITFPKEIDYVWNRSCTFVSAMFILVRYLGLAVVLIEGFYGSTFIPGPTLTCRRFPPATWHVKINSSIKGTALLIVSVWAFIIFLAASDIVMILRVYAMYGRSRTVLGVLLVFYVATIVVYAVSGAFYNNPDTYLSMTNPQVLDMSFCNPTYTTSSKLGDYKLIPRLILAALLLILAVARICVESFQTYKVFKQWAVNHYLNLLVREGILYFLVHLLYIIDFGQDVPGTMMSVVAVILMFILSPRFIMSVREMHLRNLRGPDTEIDAGFGVGSSLSSGDLASSSVRFTRPGDFGITEGDVEMQTVEGDAGPKPR